MTEDIGLLEALGVSVLLTILYPLAWVWKRLMDLADVLAFEDQSLN
jgi:hypothetical protein